tara:strand:+ start:325 stop:873 length:549 start_codon:yes stop_codon:yes gene_type:complete
MVYPMKTSKIPRTHVIRYVGIFDFDGLYKAMVGWLKARRYWFHEDTYKHKPGGPFGRELEIKWKAEKNVTEFYMNTIGVFFHIWDLSDVEVIKDGKKKKLQKARMEIHIDSDLVLEYQDKWAKNKFTSALFDFYRKYVIKREIDSLWWDTTYYRMMKFQAFIKGYLNMHAKGNEYAGYLGDS